jgi:hypothetical protein
MTETTAGRGVNLDATTFLDDDEPSNRVQLKPLGGFSRTEFGEWLRGAAPARC